MRKIKSIDQINDIDHRMLTLVQELPFDIAKATEVYWDGTEATPQVHLEILSALRTHFDYGEGMRGYLYEGSLFIYDWDWEKANFAKRYNRLEDKTGAFLRTHGLIVLINAEEIKLNNLASRNNSQCLIWPPIGEPYLYEKDLV